MKIIYDNRNEYEISDIYLCNPDRRQLAVVNGEGKNAILRLNDLSELTLNVPKYIINQQGKKIEQPCYNLLESKRLLYVNTIGWFEINKVTEEENSESIIKTVSAQSHQVILANKSLSIENKVYCFYNEDDPLDEQYDSTNLSAIPSVVGQLYQQMGIIPNLQLDDVEPTEDYKQWTITYIEPELYYRSSNTNNICRTFEKNEKIGAYDFLTNNCQEAFEVMWLFDYLHHAIKIKYISSITTPTDIYLSFDNLIESIQVDEKAEDIVTVLTCKGTNLDIRTVNPMGTGYIVNFDYYRDNNNKWMSSALREALDQWEEVYNSEKSNYATLVQSLYNKYLSQTSMQTIMTETDLKINELESARDTYISEASIIAETVFMGETSKDTNEQYLAEHEYTFHRTMPKVNGGIFSFDDSGVVCNSIIAMDNTRLYFMDSDSKTYCKLIKRDDGVYGYERYGIYEDVYNWADTAGTFGGLITAETIEASNTSLDKNSVFYTRRFVLHSNRQYNCHSKAPNIVITNTDGIPSFHFEFGEDDEVMYGTMDNCFNEGYYYILESNANSYIKLNGKSVVDNNETASYYVGSLSRYTTLDKAGLWIGYYQELENTLDQEYNAVQEEINEVLASMNEISNRCNILKFMINKDSTGALSQELECYWIEGAYENTNLAILDTTTMEESINLAKELMECGEKQIEKVSQPKYSFTITAEDFTKIKDFKKFASQLELGKTITVEKSNGNLFTPAVTEISLNLEDPEDFNLVFASSATVNGNEFTFADMIAESHQTTKEIISNWQDLIDYSKNKEKITNLIFNPLDRTLRYGQDKLSRQQFVVDNTGILGRRYSDESKTTFDDEQIRIINNLILFTDDNWKSTKTALGRIFYEQDGQEKSAYGLIAEAIIGSLIMGETLQIINADSSILLNDIGITIKSGNDIVFKADTEGNLLLQNKANTMLFADNGLSISNGQSTIELSTTNELMMNIKHNDNTIFSVDNTGKLSIISGYIGSLTEGFLINDKYISHNLTNSASRVLIGSGEDGASFNVSNRSVSHLMLMAGENFGVTRAGDLYANSGYIADLKMEKTSVSETTSGDYIKINNELFNVNSLDKYREIFVESSNGSYIKVGDNYVEGTGLLQYDGYYVINPNGLYYKDGNNYFLISLAQRYQFSGYINDINGKYTMVENNVYVVIDDYQKYSPYDVYTEDINGNYVLYDSTYITYSEFRNMYEWYDYDEEFETYYIDQDGWYLLLENEYILQDKPTRYSKSVSYAQNDDGNYLKIEDNYYFITPVSKYYTMNSNGDFIKTNNNYVLLSDVITYTYEYSVLINSQYVLYSSLQKYDKSYVYDSNGEYILIDNDYIDCSSLPKYNEDGTRATIIETASGLYSDNFTLETRVGINDTSSMLCFFDGVGNTKRETIRLTSRNGISAESGIFNTVESTQATLYDINTNKILTTSGLQIYDNYIHQSSDGSYIQLGAQISGSYYTAKLSHGFGPNIYLTIYNSKGERARLPKSKSFKIKYACIWGKESTYTFNLDAGSDGATLDTHAFIGVDYHRFVDNNSESITFSISVTAGQPTIKIKGHIMPDSNSTYDLGTDNYRWNNIYSKNGQVTSSDIKYKKDVSDLNEKHSALFDLLHPVTFKFKENESDRTHLGLIANEFEESIKQVGLTTKDVASFCSWTDEDGTKGCGIRYTELIALNIYEIQKLKERVKELENKLSKLNN